VDSVTRFNVDIRALMLLRTADSTDGAYPLQSSSNPDAGQTLENVPRLLGYRLSIEDAIASGKASA
jgi:hypothetical protein